jgi:electron transfer flavoprotein beta subunit
MAAKKAVIQTWKAADMNCDPKCLGLDGSPTKVVKIFTPPPRQGGEIFKGEPQDFIPQLVAKMKDAVLGAAQ